MGRRKDHSNNKIRQGISNRYKNRSAVTKQKAESIASSNTVLQNYQWKQIPCTGCKICNDTVKWVWLSIFLSCLICILTSTSIYSSRKLKFDFGLPFSSRCFQLILTLNNYPLYNYMKKASMLIKPHIANQATLNKTYVFKPYDRRQMILLAWNNKTWMFQTFTLTIDTFYALKLKIFSIFWKEECL